MSPIAAQILMLCSVVTLAQDSGSFHPLPVEEMYSAMLNRQTYSWTNAPLRDAIARAISFSAPSPKIALVSEELMTASGGDDQVALIETLGTNNLSSFLMTISDTYSEKYEIETDVPLLAFVFGQRTLSGLSAVLLDDIVEHHLITSTLDSVTGHFVIEIPKCLRMRCVYAAHRDDETWVVHRLVVSRKDSLKIEEGLDVIKMNLNQASEATSDYRTGIWKVFRGIMGEKGSVELLYDDKQQNEEQDLQQRAGEHRR